MTLLGAGRSHEFKSIYAEATATFDAAFDATASAVAAFLATLSGNRQEPGPAPP
jgi:hypothetical protein